MRLRSVLLPALFTCGAALGWAAFGLATGGLARQGPYTIRIVLPATERDCAGPCDRAAPSASLAEQDREAPGAAGSGVIGPAGASTLGSTGGGAVAPPAEGPGFIDSDFSLSPVADDRKLAAEVDLVSRQAGVGRLGILVSADGSIAIPSSEVERLWPALAPRMRRDVASIPVQEFREMGMTFRYDPVNDRVQVDEAETR